MDSNDFLASKPLVNRVEEKDFRGQLKEHDWEQYEDKVVLISCSNDAIIPIWAYMLISSYLEGVAIEIYHGKQDAYLSHYYHNTIATLDLSEYENERVIVKGCSNQPVPHSAYAALTHRLRPIAKSIMFGEPCSTVPIYKKPRK